ncbi:MAG: histidine phosphatase family protein, partial [Ruminiclostridium sp.]|nr:histidine phosphatase family protein [Ruminiclostridium sp.]
MIHIYFIRHAQSDRSFQQEQGRPLTAEGVSDSEKITEVLKDKGITHILSSPYKRTLQTVESLSEALGINIEIDEDLKERDAGKWHGDRFFDYVKQQWENFDYASDGGESLRQVQCRNIN